MTHRQTSQSRAFPMKQRLSKILIVDGANFTRHVQAFINRVGHFSTGTEDVRFTAFGRFGKCGPLPCALTSVDGLRHDCRQKPRPESELLIKPSVLRTLGKCKQASMTGSPPLETI